MVVEVCVGSSCHLKGSYEVIGLFKARIAKDKLEDKIDLKGTFCLGKCGIAGVSIRVDEQIITGVTPGNFDEVFDTYILSKVA